MRNLGYLIVVIIAIANASSVIAESYSNHEAVQLFRDNPCSDVVNYIEGGKTAEAMLSGDTEQLMQAVAKQGMIWGFLLGYDTKAGGLNSEHETTLQRLKDECSIDSQATAVQILEGLK